MKAMHWLLPALAVAPVSASAAPVTSESEATTLALTAIHKYHLTTLKDECGVADVTEHKSFFDIDVRERHTPACGGDPETKPRLFTIRVRKRDGRLTSDVYDGVTYQPVNRRHQAHPPLNEAPRPL
jgi:hypothetical protein